MPRRTEASAITAKVGNRLRELRFARGLTLETVGDGGGLSKGHLSSVENGLAAMTVETAERAAQGLGVPLLAVFTFPEEGELSRIVNVLLRWSPQDLKRLRIEVTARTKPAAVEGNEAPR